MANVAVMMADGCEEIEALTVVDLLRRGKITCDMLSISGSLTVTGSHGIAFSCDALLSEKDVNTYDALVLPGGMPGTVNLKESEGIQKALKDFSEQGKLLAAICAAPALVLGEGGFLEGYEATCYPGMEDHLKGAKVRTDVPAVRDRDRITSRGLGTAIPFALSILSFFDGAEAAGALKEAIVFSPEDML